MRMEAQALHAGYGAKEVLTDVSVTLDSGEFVGLIGPNGCGKSTLLRVLTLTLPARQGRILLDGHPIVGMSRLDLARRIAFVPQQEPATFDFTVREVVLMGRYPHRRRGLGDTEADFALVRQILTETDLLALADRPITRLSGGEHRRVLMARALVQQTPLLLLDEPTAHLDPTHQVELMQRVQSLTRQRNIGALAALHDLNQAAEYCDRLVLMAAGSVLAVGTPKEVLTSENLRIAYAAETQIGINPVTGRLSVFALRPLRTHPPSTELPRIHVVCGGGSGVALLGTLVQHGFATTVGVLNRLDSDQIAAETLNLPAAVDHPFTAISPEIKTRCAHWMQQADILLVTDVPFGRGNIANLELVEAAQQAGKQVILLGETPFSQRDFCEGVALRIFGRLMANGAVSLPRIEDWSILQEVIAHSTRDPWSEPALAPAEPSRLRTSEGESS
jgi:iron complex transport system ATP-binding protein